MMTTMTMMTLRAARVADPEPRFNPRHDAADSRHSHRSSRNSRARSSSCPWAKDYPADSKRMDDPSSGPHRRHSTSLPAERPMAVPTGQHLNLDDAARRSDRRPLATKSSSRYRRPGTRAAASLAAAAASTICTRKCASSCRQRCTCASAAAGTCSPGVSPCATWIAAIVPHNTAASPNSTSPSIGRLQPTEETRVLLLDVKEKATGIMHDYLCDYLPRIFDMFELCMSGQAFKIFLRSSLAHTINAFIGRLICGLFSPSLFCCLTILAEERERGA